MSRNCFFQAAVCGMLLLVGCSDSETPVGPVTPAPVAEVRVTPGTSTLPPGQTRQLTAVTLDAGGRTLANRAVTWTTSAPTVAEVSPGGVVTAVGNGSATITAASEGRSGTAVITVALPVATVTVSPALDTLEAYETRNLQAVLRDSAGTVLTGRTVTWTSSDPSVATINPVTGVLTGVDRGTVTITATSEDRSGTVSRVVVIRYRSLTTGASHACNLASGGIAWCWGLNGRDGRIGGAQLGDNEHSTIPIQVPGGHRFSRIATYGPTTCGISLEGRAFCWGSNQWGVLGTGASTPQQSFTPVPVAGGHTFIEISAGALHFCGVTAQGKAYCWGHNGMGELGTGNRTNSTTPVPAAPNLSFVRITAGSEYSCALTAAGQAYCWGYDGVGNLGDGRPMSFGNTYVLAPVQVTGGHGWRQLSAGRQHTCGVTVAGVAYCWGRNSSRLGNGQGGETSTPSAVAGGHIFRSVSAGFYHSCGVTAEDAVYCWGLNGNGELGVTLANGSNVPVRAGTITASEVSAANASGGAGLYTCAISPDRLTTRCWGRNDLGQLGNGTTTAAAAVNSAPTIVHGQRPT
ncbi:MAG: hypothetical protein EA350_07740 [Gemmatimonadales bacterium]|nr:MAG: hypothetical protein EA350_07740 [Gemmatimonadales bacterium]